MEDRDLAYIYYGVWYFFVMIPVVISWAAWAPSHGISPILFAYALIYGIALMSALPWVLYWLRRPRFMWKRS